MGWSRSLCKRVPREADGKEKQVKEGGRREQGRRSGGCCSGLQGASDSAAGLGKVWTSVGAETELSDVGNMKMFVLSNENNGRV